LLGSYRQAKSEFGEYWHSLSDPERATIKSQRRFVRGVLASQDTGAVMQIARTALVGFLSLSRVELKSENGQKAVKAATAWGLILIGSVAASPAGRLPGGRADSAAPAVTAGRCELLDQSAF
jgi:hypothetical protein